MLMNVKLSIAHIGKNECRNTGKTRFSRGLRECGLHIYFPNILLHFSFAPSERTAPAFLHRYVLSKNTQPQQQPYSAFDQWPSKPSSLSPSKSQYWLKGFELISVCEDLMNWSWQFAHRLRKVSFRFCRFKT